MPGSMLGNRPLRRTNSSLCISEEDRRGQYKLKAKQDAHSYSARAIRRERGSTDVGQNGVKVAPVVGSEGTLKGDTGFEGYPEGEKIFQ